MLLKLKFILLPSQKLNSLQVIHKIKPNIIRLLHGVLITAILAILFGVFFRFQIVSFNPL